MTHSASTGFSPSRPVASSRWPSSCIIVAAQQVLAEMCGRQVDDEVIRQTTHAEARRAAQDRPTRTDATSFTKAAGEVEVLIDAGKVNALDGWRDVKLGCF